LSIAESISADLPYLRRFARSVTGSQRSGDAYVVTTLEAILADPALIDMNLAPRAALYKAFLRILDSVTLDGAQAETPQSAEIAAARRNLQALAPKARQAFLLVAVEEFAPREAARIMGVSETAMHALIDEAGRDIARQVATEVVIIEDEPLIALDLVQLVNDLGHRVVQVARTAREAVEATRRLEPGLVIADIHLADGSSGLDAVNEILRTVSLPVIFVTAFPQRLLTGTRPEPTFLITKPFQPQNVKAVISQALFFDIRGRPEPADPGGGEA
jgi:DNA-directed RNA polymerase specialized sigma24 family protein